MNIVFIGHALKDPNAWRLALGINKIICIEQTDKFLGMRDAAIALDELIYIDREPVDFVLYCNNESGIVKWLEFLNKAPHIDPKSDTIYFTQTKAPGPGPEEITDLTGNFYCRPHIFTVMGSLYKIDIEATGIMKDSIADMVSTKILYGLAKGGYNIVLL